MAGIYHSISASDLRTRIAYRLGDPAHAIWYASEIVSYIRTGYDLLTLSTGCLWTKGYVPDVASQATYDLDPGTYEVERVTWNLYKIAPLNPVYLQTRHPSFQSMTGQVIGYLIGEDGPNVLRKVQIPAASNATIFSIEYTRRGDPLDIGTPGMRIDEFSAPADIDGNIDEAERMRFATFGFSLQASRFFQIPDRYVAYVGHYAMYRALAREGEGQQLKLADHYKQRWAADIQRVIDRKDRAQTRHRTGVFGDAAPSGYGPPPRPRLPWNFGVVVK